MSDLAGAPKWFLRILAGITVVLILGWAAHVERHINEAGTGYQRIASLEAQVAGTVARQTSLESQVTALQAHVAWCRAQHRRDAR